MKGTFSELLLITYELSRKTEYVKNSKITSFITHSCSFDQNNITRNNPIIFDFNNVTRNNNLKKIKIKIKWKKTIYKKKLVSEK